MVLDFLPYKKPQAARKKIGFIRYITFAFSFLFVVMLFLNHVGNMENHVYSFYRGEYSVLYCGDYSGIPT